MANNNMCTYTINDLFHVISGSGLKRYNAVDGRDKTISEKQVWRVENVQIHWSEYVDSLVMGVEPTMFRLRVRPGVEI
jgi:hypothetical protein